MGILTQCVQNSKVRTRLYIYMYVHMSTRSYIYMYVHMNVRICTFELRMYPKSLFLALHNAMLKSSDPHFGSFSPLPGCIAFVCCASYV